VSQQIEGDQVVAFLQGAELFRSLDRAALHRLAGQLEPVHVPAGGVLLEQGDPGDCLYLLHRGRLRVYLSEAGRERPLQELSPGHVVGEIALLTEQPRAASVRAVRDSDLFRLPAAAFRDLVDRHPAVLRQVSHVLIDRLLTADRPAGDATTVRTIAVVPSGRSQDLSDFCKLLVAALGRYGSTTLVSSRAVGEILGADIAQGPPDAARPGSLNALLQDLERDHRYIVYAADPSPSEWTRRSLRQADLVLLVADATMPPPGHALEAGPLTEAGQGTMARRELVLVHRRGTERASGAAAWLDAVPVSAHHHVRADRDADYQRLARFVTGRACGLVLSGGAARGLAHLGVMKALEEAGVPMDFVGGTSIGAVVGAFLAQGLDHEARVQVAAEAMGDRRLAVNYTFPMVSLSSGRKVTRFLRKHLDGLDIEDLWTPYFCVSANLTRASVVVHERGELAQAVRASMSLPGIFPPVFHEGDLLIDGGVMNNLPVDVMSARLRGGPLIASDLNTEVELRAAEPFDVALSGWLVLLRKLSPLSPALAAPGIHSVLMRTLELGDSGARRDRIQAAPIALHLRPPVGPCGMFDFRAAFSLIEVAYRYTLDRLETSTLAGVIW
jgi:predicted acylesterase/phospholipase RssA/CRP-like cAMP-binding protein